MGYNKSKEFGIETPEAGDAPNITSDLKKFAEGVDALLKKQITKVFELAKLKITETVELPAESLKASYLKASELSSTQIKAKGVEAASMAEGSVTAANKALAAKAVVAGNIEAQAVGDAAIATGRALVDTENSYSARTSVLAEEELTPSATRFAQIVLSLQSNEPFAGAILVGGVTIAALEYSAATGVGGFSADSRTATFLVPPGLTWKYKHNSGTVTLVYSKLLL